MQAVDQSPRLRDKVENATKLIRRYVPEPLRDAKLRFRLLKGAVRNAEKLDEFAGAPPPLAFRYVGRHGHG